MVALAAGHMELKEAEKNDSLNLQEWNPGHPPLNAQPHPERSAHTQPLSYPWLAVAGALPQGEGGAIWLMFQQYELGSARGGFPRGSQEWVIGRL